MQDTKPKRKQAIALEYNPSEEAPKIIASGKGFLAEKIIEKAKERKGLSHREASVLLACEEEDLNQEIYKLAEQIKKDFYGNRIVMFAPLYLSNYCVNGCVYCPYHLKNKHIARKKRICRR